MNNGVHLMLPNEDCSDEELMSQLAAGAQEALGPLYSRYARLIFHLAAQTLDRSAAEEIIQDVFLAVWRRASTFDPVRGAFRPWVLQIAHFRILNELRRRSRQPRLEPDLDGLLEASLPDDSLEPAEAFQRASIRATLQEALADLPTPQRQVLDLAFGEDLTHEQVAAALNLPLGTTKTRIRAGMQNLRNKLAPRMAVLALVGFVAFLGVRYQAELVTRQRDERALSLLTTSDLEAIRLAQAPGMPAQTHGHYRGRAGAEIAVLSLSHFPLAPAGQIYQGWVLHEGRWTSLGMVQPDVNGNAHLIAEGPELAAPPEAVQVTLEPAGGSPVPSGPVVITWQSGSSGEL
jgi:RNA polymerase sigma-70 factor (ECF subfamily)